MQKPSEEARYLASWLKLREYDVIDVGYEWAGIPPSLEEEALVKLIDEYFNSRK